MSFLIFNLFVGVVVVRFRESDKGQSVFLSPEQQEWVQVHEFIMAATPPHVDYFPPEKWREYRLWAFRIVKNPRFELVVFTAVCVNIVVMSME